MLTLALNALASVLVASIAIHAVILHVRLGRLRAALSEMGSVLPEFDASVNRIAAMADGFTDKVSAELAGIEGRLQAARRFNAELATASRAAEEAAAQLERALRQHKRLEAVRAAALPRELVEPKGFAERAGLPPMQLASGDGAPPPPAAEPAPAPAASDDLEQCQPIRPRLKHRRASKAVRHARASAELDRPYGFGDAEPAGMLVRDAQEAAA